MAIKIKDAKTRPVVPEELKPRVQDKPARITDICADCTDQSGCASCQVPSRKAKLLTQIPD